MSKRNMLVSQASQIELILIKIKEFHFYTLLEDDNLKIARIYKLTSKINTSSWKVHNIVQQTPTYSYSFTAEYSINELLREMERILSKATNEIGYLIDKFNGNKIKLVVPAEIYWRNYLDKKDCPGCSGLGSCDYCNKSMYPHRTGYLKSWMTVYKKNRSDIEKGIAIMPKLYWFAIDSANKFKLGDYHHQTCNSGKSVIECECDIANLLRSMYYATEDLEVASLDQIIPVYRKIQC